MTARREQIDGHFKRKKKLINLIVQILTGSILSKIGIFHTNFTKVWKNSAYKISSYFTQGARVLAIHLKILFLVPAIFLI